MEHRAESTDHSVATDGFEFIEYTAPDTHALASLFERMGFSAIARHRSKDVILYRQGGINFIINHEPHSFAQAFARVHGPSVCAFAIRVHNAEAVFQRAIQRGAKPYYTPVGPQELEIPAIRGIGGSLVYLVECGEQRSIYDVDFIPLDSAVPGDAGLTRIDHLTHNVRQGRMDAWANFYERLFNFREIRYFDIHGAATGLRSRALASPCGEIRIPINEPADEKSQVQEYIAAYHGEGIQHIALATDNIYASVEALRARGVEFMQVPAAYYAAVDERVPGHGEDSVRLQRDAILIDGSRTSGLLLQIFTTTVIGPIFFEIIQRKGNDGFGEGNFKALFEAIERDQMARGVI
jgi:4-hydroxyphenylpyruvate dioxygenase